MSAKSKTPIVWPEGHFTIDQVQTSHPDMVNITLRFRVKKATENGEIATIGRLKPAIGRPKLVFAKTPVTEDVIKAAYATGVLPPLDDSTRVPVINVKQSVKAVVPTVPATTDVKAPAQNISA
jgi:hypothetical protein